MNILLDPNEVDQYEGATDKLFTAAGILILIVIVVGALEVTNTIDPIIEFIGTSIANIYGKI